jgi:flagellar basal body P-ring formation protein FlgA
MRCSRKSTTWRASALCLWVVGAVAAPAAAQGVPSVPQCARPDVAGVLAQAVAGILGGGPSPKVQVAMCDVVADAKLETALIEPGGRFGRPVRFRLMDRGRQVGYAVATASGPVRQLRTRQAIAGGASVEAADVEIVTEDATGALIERLPAVEDVVGARVVRPLVAGEMLTSRLVRVNVAVRSGDRVVIRATVGSVQITGVATAQQTGSIGDVIRLVNVDSRRALRGRITGKGEVEVVHGS